ncbi:LysR substrate-binding domain-containing protein [Kocuria tytonis]|uniref:LysR substrate-binding domain-containing protein n=1 Tax=Kocuria tytonis TaxID=2054280 RepID=A0A495AAQ9_9MICC|nr:LysR substrate-binding domain-containing protein [Kocuria tytonis]RKQ36863.1 hypothetical protein C1C97_004450 [Kocuria tytonis]
MSPADPSSAPSHPGHEGSAGQPGEAGAAAAADRATGQDAGEAPFTIGYVPGVMPGKWFGRWRGRRMRPVLHDALLPAAGWRAALDHGAVTACFVRLGWAPGDPSLDELRTTHHAVGLYEERQVAVLGTDDVLGVLDTLTTAQLHEESTPQPHAAIDDAAMAVELAAAGAGPVVLPMLVARLHARKDVTTRELTDAPTVPVVLVWPKSVAEDTEDAVQRFVGIVRGRRESSGRDEGTQPQRAASSGEGAAHGGARSTATGARDAAQTTNRQAAPEESEGATAPAEAGTTSGKVPAKRSSRAQSGGWAKAGASTKPGLRRKPGRKVKNSRSKKRR